MIAPLVLDQTSLESVTEAGGIVRAVVDADWQLAFLHGGSVMAASLEASELVVGEPGLLLLSASTTFSQPLMPGVVQATVTALRRSRSGIQVRVDLSNTDQSGVGLTTIAVFGRPSEGWIDANDLERPDDLGPVPDADVRRLGGSERGYGNLPFFSRTSWCVAPPEAKPMRRRGWFRFEGDDPAAPMSRSSLAIPADALGFATISAASDDPTYAVSLQMSLHVHQDPSEADGAPEWVGIESSGLVLDHGIVSGVTHLWSADGRPLATSTQTASMRRATSGRQ